MSDPDNPFAALSGLGNLPKGPDHVPELKEEGGGDAGANLSASIRILLDRKQRKGKPTTIVTGLADETDDYLKALGKELKTACGVGGSVKNGELIIQGNQRDKVLKILREKGFKDVKKAGG